MLSFGVLLGVVSLTVTTSMPVTNFATILSHSSSVDIGIAEENNIANWDDYYEYLSSTNSSPGGMYLPILSANIL